jgi:uncharacterized sporulation protein YeaH/YhbH (DUF444 family)
MMEGLQSNFNNLALRHINDENEVIEVFRSLFTTKASVAA